ncbi:hypothetical protein [Methylobacterium sp. J-076]|uniref:hypothetical protein n=1 Tax=Methylobacterium sp. J-076 TaxID=2836655 RepID=UPI001FB90333|nr:hypothetical protein [Methylobacterium sp. J-076]MCJ2013178.1 hypothetical protein [Methylobacterium sp. J-076]
MSGGRSSAGLVPAMLAALALRASGLVPRRGGTRGGGADSGEPKGPGHETRDVNVRNTALVMGGLALSAVAVVGGMVLLMNLFAARQRAALPGLTPQQTARLVPPPPNLQPDPYEDLARQRDGARAALDGYGYLNPAHDRARVPIDRAMELVVGRSLDGGAPR